MRRLSRLAISTVLFVGACSAPTVTPDVFRHSLTVQPNGKPHELNLEPAIPGFDGQWTFQDQMRMIAASPEWDAKDRVLIFIHGGLNSIDGGLERTAEAIPKIRDDSGGATYPIFINWNSSLTSGYCDHLLKFRNGEESYAELRWAASPFYLLADAGRAIARAPILFGTQGAQLIDHIATDEVGAEIPAQWRSRVKLDPREPTWGAWAQFVDGATQVFPGFLRILSTPFIDTVGFEGYTFLQRRIDTQFFTDDDLRARTDGPTGAMTALMEAIGTDKEIVLIGHSMGAIVAAELLRRFPEHNFRNVVFMGAACSVKNFFDSVPDYIGHALQKGRECDFYNLCLHPEAEVSENSLYSLVPNGSLLVWLDEYVNRPRDILQRTFGKWNNAVRVLHLLGDVDPRVLERIHMKGFSVHGDDFPSTHGSFDDYRFWRPEFWDPNHVEPVGR